MVELRCDYVVSFVSQARVEEVKKRRIKKSESAKTLIIKTW